jgi:Tol biopolymer transport system component
VRVRPAGRSQDVHEIITVDRDGRSARVLAGPRALPFGDLAWSPDGGRLAYKAPYVDPADGIKVGLFVVPEAGGRPRFLLWAISLADPSWSPGGRLIAFAANEPGSPPLAPYRLFTISVAARRIVQVTHPLGDHVSDIAPRWSPDGRTIVFTRFRVDRPAVLAVRPNGHRATLLADDAQQPAWSPDGRQIVYVAHVVDLRRSLTLAVMKSDGAHLRALAALHRPEDGFDLSAQSWHG